MYSQRQWLESGRRQSYQQIAEMCLQDMQTATLHVLYTPGPHGKCERSRWFKVFEHVARHARSPVSAGAPQKTQTRVISDVRVWQCSHSWGGRDCRYPHTPDDIDSSGLNQKKSWCLLASQRRTGLCTLRSPANFRPDL